MLRWATTSAGVRLAGDGALDSLLGRLIVELLDLLVVFRLPVDEDADADEQVVGLLDRDRAVGDAVGDGLGDRMLRRAEHLHGLLGALDGDLVEHHGRGFGHEVRRDHREERGKAVFVVGQSRGEGRFRGAAARPDDEVDVGDLIAVADQRLADKEFLNLSHLTSSQEWRQTPELSQAAMRRTAYPCCQHPALVAGPVGQIAAGFSPLS